MPRRAPGQTTVTYTVPAWMKKAMNQLAKKRLTYASALAREALLEYLKKNGFKTPS